MCSPRAAAALRASALGTVGEAAAPGCAGMKDAEPPAGAAGAGAGDGAAAGAAAAARGSATPASALGSAALGSASSPYRSAYRSSASSGFDMVVIAKLAAAAPVAPRGATR